MRKFFSVLQIMHDFSSVNYIGDNWNADNKTLGNWHLSSNENTAFLMRLSGFLCEAFPAFINIFLLIEIFYLYNLLSTKKYLLRGFYYLVCFAYLYQTS